MTYQTKLYARAEWILERPWYLWPCELRGLRVSDEPLSWCPPQQTNQNLASLALHFGGRVAEFQSQATQVTLTIAPACP